MQFCFEFNLNRNRPNKSPWRTFDNNKIFLPAGELVAIALLQSRLTFRQVISIITSPGMDQLGWTCNIGPLMGTLFQTFNFMENKTNTAGEGGLYFEIPFFSILLHNKTQRAINLLFLAWFCFVLLHTTKEHEARLRDLKRLGTRT